MSSGVFWPAHAGVAAMAGGSEHTPEEEGGRGQAAVGQQARQTAAGQRWNHRGNIHSEHTAAASLNQAPKVFTLTQALP